MGRIFVKLIGLILLIAGLYFLSQNIFFGTTVFRYFWRSIPAAGSILCLMGGVISLVFLRRETGYFGWILLGLGAILVFLSGGVFLRPTSLWSFLVSFSSMAVGFKLITEGRVQF